MENNKILIGVQFVYSDGTKNAKGEPARKNYTLELYTLKDITLRQLLDGVKYGLDRAVDEDPQNREIYTKCKAVFNNCISKIAQDKKGVHYTNILLTSFNANMDRKGVLYKEDGGKSICDLGFINSTRLVFDETGNAGRKGQYNTSHLTEAFDPEKSEIFYPEYNISTRQLYKFNDTPVNIIPPSEPPKKHPLSMMIPSLYSVGTKLIQNDQYKKDLAKWKSRYQNYIDNLIVTIKNRQAADVKKLDQLYPDMLTLINEDRKGVYALNDRLYSRSPNDNDFLSFRVGLSDDVPSLFAVTGEKKDAVFSDAGFQLTKDNRGNEHITLITSEEMEDDMYYSNITEVPHTISGLFSCLKNAPLLYSLKNKAALGIVDRKVKSELSKGGLFISRMLFELCYYHSPEKLQFVVFFNKEENWSDIERTIQRYKFMPHFRGLFEDKSQFVFDEDSARQVLDNLNQIISGRDNTDAETENTAAPLPHIVFLVFDDHGLKEHVFAEYLPKVPAPDKEQGNPLGISFVFAKEYKEHLPEYCDDIADFTGVDTMIVPRNSINIPQTFRLPSFDAAEYITKLNRAFSFLSSVQLAQIAQNGNVPSTVTLFEVLGVENKDKLEEKIRTNWGIGTEKRDLDITRSLSTAIGKTDSSLAYLDLHEKFDGPHMLVAGTTGSGKTETIITYLLGLCMQFTPQELNMLLVDMKGGGFTKRLGSLPHVVGAVTDVDGDENGAGAVYMLNRFLQSIQAEVKKRKILFNKLRVDSIDDYIRAWRDINAHIAAKKIPDEVAKDILENKSKHQLAHLLLVIDEFTELKRFSAENSEIDFIKEITTIARIGRSLGFHIILISQNIEGAITEDIRVNSKSRLCLKVATKRASKEMLGNDLAAHPSMPGYGRAYLMVGTGSRLDYFQSGYASVDVGADIPVEITYARKQGPYTVFYKSDKDNEEIKKQKKQNVHGQTQLEAVVEAIEAVCKKEKLLVPNRIYKAPLPDNLAYFKGKVYDLNKRLLWKEW